VVAELRTPGHGGATLIASHLLLLCLQLWRLGASHDERREAAARGGGAALVGNFMQMVELHYRDGWPVARYAAALGVTSDKLHAHCQREKGCGPRALIHERLVREACTRLQQLDLPVEQIGYGLGFRDPAYFNRFFRKYRGASPGTYRRQIRLEHARSRPSYAAWP
jgi:AraC family transcriptional regulator, transcriptional activator of pobA